jgi:hypothetical protein
MPSIRPLHGGDLDALVNFFGANALPRETLALELDCAEAYLWMGLFDDEDGRLAAVHRGLNLGGYLLLKGVTVAPRLQGSTAVLHLALAITEQAKATGWRGVAVWIEPNKPERHIAARLRIAAQGPLVHRYLIPVGTPGDGTPLAPSARCGTLSIDLGGAPLVPNLLTPQARGFDWVLDQQRLMLSGNPCPGAAAMPDLLRELGPLAQAIGASGVEIHLPAADLLAAISILSPGVKRLSRTPVRLGVRRFAAAPATSRPEMAMVP